MKKRVLVFFIGAVFLSGCNTPAHDKLSFLMENIPAASKRFADCQDRVKSTPEYRVVEPHGYWAKLNAEQLADNSLATEDEIKALLILREEGRKCRNEQIKDFSVLLPGMVPILTKAYADADIISDDLSARKITWGEAQKRKVALDEESKSSIQELLKQVVMDLYSPRQAEKRQ